MPMRPLTLAVLLAGCTGLAIQTLGAQAPAPGTLVHLDLAVVDDAGQPVHGLGPADFEILRDDAPIVPAGFTPVEIAMPELGGARPAAGQLAPRHVPFDVLRNDDLVGRYVVLVLDDIRLPENEAGATWMATSGLGLVRAVVDRLTPADRGAVFFSWLGRRQGLTGDRLRLLAAIDEFATRPVAPSECGPAGCLVDTLQGAVEILPTMPTRRKVIVYVSGSAALPLLELPVSGSTAATPMARVYQSLQQANTVVYSILAPGVARAPTEGALTLPAATGGRTIVDAMAGPQIEALFRETGSYYLLSLPAGEGPAGFHRLTVRLGRSGAHVRTRSGFFAPSASEPAASGALTPLEAAMVAPQPSADLPIGAAVAAFASPDRREAIVSIVSAVTGAVAGGAKSWQAEVATTAFDSGWQPRASHRQTIEVTPRGASRTQTVDVITALELLPGRYEVRVAAQNGDRAGTVFVDLDIPEFSSAPLSVSGAVVTTMPAPYAASELLAATLPVTPTTRRLFRTDETAEVFIRIYQAVEPRDVSVSLRIADARGEGIIQGTEEVTASSFDASGATDWRFVLPLDRLTPGEYLLTIDAVLDDRTETRHVRFAVVGTAASR